MLKEVKTLTTIPKHLFLTTQVKGFSYSMLKPTNSRLSLPENKFSRKYFVTDNFKNFEMFDELIENNN